ncbi:MAG: hypothetical protein NC191_00490 [Muribaculaceae bacterium]|nr:hypothetical protein [Muribaculaceae bacterium]
MQISPKSNNLNFGYKAAIDIGASVSGGSFKIKLFNNGLIIDEFSKHLSPGGVKSSNEFIERITDSIDFAAKMAKNATEKLSDTKERKLESINIFIAGRPEKQNENSYIINRIRNIRSTETGESLKDVDFTSLSAKFDSSVYVFNDMIGAACAGLQRQPMEGNSAMFITTGGGFGVSHIKKIKLDGKDFFQITESRDGRQLLEGKPLEEYGASVPALIKNYFKHQNISESTVQELVDIGDARVVLHENPTLINKYGLDISPKNTLFALKRYIEAISHAIKLRAEEGLDTVLMSGNLISGINEYLMRNSKMFGKQYTDLEKLISERISKPIKIHIIEGIKDNCDGAMFLENKVTKTQMSQERGLPVMSLLVRK